MTAAVHEQWPATAGDAVPAGDADAYARATRLIASAAVVLVGLDLHVAYGATAALPAAIVLLPFWLPVLREHSFATLVAGLAALSALAGLVLSELSSVDHVISATSRNQAIGLLASGIAAFGLILWSRAELPLHRIAVLYGAGGLTSALAHGDLGWKYNLAVPTTFVVLGVLERRRVSPLPAMAVLALGVVGVAFGARGYSGVCVLAATLTFWQLRPGRQERRMRAGNGWFPIVLVAGLGIATYIFTSSLDTGGGLGESLQGRSAAQVAASRPLVAGGRPEWAATRELVELNPGGYGAGVVPNWTDRTAGETGLASINVDAGGCYADNYMFGNTFELHSVTADLWARFGWVGVALAVALAVALVRSLSVVLAARRAPTYLIFACLLALWYLLFGPMYSSWLDVCAALGLALVPVGAGRAAANATL